MIFRKDNVTDFERAYRETQNALRHEKALLKEARDLILRLRGEMEARRWLLTTIAELTDGGIDHLSAEDAYKLRTVHELATKGTGIHTPNPKHARAVPSEIRRAKVAEMITEKMSDNLTAKNKEMEVK